LHAEAHRPAPHADFAGHRAAWAAAMMRVDAHHHVWRIGRGDYGWLKPGSPLHRDYRLADLRPLLGDIQATVLVQAAPTEAETAYLLNVARNSEGLVRAVVGWDDLAGRHAPERIATLAADPLLKGLRPMLQDIADTGWALRPGLRPGFAAMVQCGLRFDALVQPRHLPVLLEFCGMYPDLPVVVDHGAKPAIAGGGYQPWADGIARLARETPAFCKLSGLVTEAAPDWQADDLRRYSDHLLACFGPQRVMWGSDWPVVNLAGGYARWHDTALSLLQGLAAAEQDAVLGGTAARFYGF
jgi:L-fuconolactonase